jgi:curved DNA-binding protein
LEVKLPVSVSEAALGATIDVPTPGGTVALKIPAGSSSGRRLRVKGQGVKAASGSGDLYVELQIKIPERFASDNESPEVRAAAEAFEALYESPLRDKLMW